MVVISAAVTRVVLVAPTERAIAPTPSLRAKTKASTTPAFAAMLPSVFMVVA